MSGLQWTAECSSSSYRQLTYGSTPAAATSGASGLTSATTSGAAVVVTGGIVAQLTLDNLQRILFTFTIMFGTGEAPHSITWKQMAH